MPNSTVFFSYSRADGQFVLQLAKDLRLAGANIWLDQLDIKPGARWDEAIEEALQTSGTMLVVLSKTSVASINVLDEVSYALEEGKKVLPILLEECDIPFRMKRLQYADFTQDPDAGFQTVAEALGLDPAKVSMVRKTLENKTASKAKTNKSEPAQQAKAAPAPPKEPIKMASSVSSESKSTGGGSDSSSLKKKLPILIVAAIILIGGGAWLIHELSHSDHQTKTTEIGNTQKVSPVVPKKKEVENPGPVVINTPEETLEDKLWNEAIDNAELEPEDKSKFEAYLLLFDPTGSHVEEAQAHIKKIDEEAKKALEAEELEEWEKAENIRNQWKADADPKKLDKAMLFYGMYKNDYPDGQFVDTAEVRLALLRAALGTQKKKAMDKKLVAMAWNEADSLNSVLGYIHFLMNPLVKGEQRAQAMAALQSEDVGKSGWIFSGRTKDGAMKNQERNFDVLYSDNEKAEFPFERIPKVGDVVEYIHNEAWFTYKELEDCNTRSASSRTGSIPTGTSALVLGSSYKETDGALFLHVKY